MLQELQSIYAGVALGRGHSHPSHYIGQGDNLQEVIECANTAYWDISACA